MTIGGYSIGSDEGVIYIRAEYPLAVGRLKKAIDQAREFGFLGKNILGTDFNFDINIKFGAGAFVCGEESLCGLELFIIFNSTADIIDYFS